MAFWNAEGRGQLLSGRWAAAQLSLLGMVCPASADFVIREARIGQGDLWVAGEVDQPNTIVTLDDSFSEKTDERGRFQFRIAYHPATCTVLLRAGEQSRPVVIENCGQRGPPGPPGAAVSATTPSPAFETRDGTACGARAALYAGEKGLSVWVMRKGRMDYENPLRPLTKERILVFEVLSAGRHGTAYGPDADSLLRGGAPQDVEKTFGAKIAWESGTGDMPEVIQIVSESGGDPLARLQFKECGEAPKQPRAAQSKTPTKAQDVGTKPAPKKPQAQAPIREEQAPPPGKPLSIKPATPVRTQDGPPVAPKPNRPTQRAAPSNKVGEQSPTEP